MKNILVVSVNWLGDAVFSTPVYKNIKENHPGARVTAMAVPRVKAVLELCPFIDDIIVYDEDGDDRPLLDKWRLALMLRERKFDAVFLLRPSFSRALLTFLAGIPVRVGFGSKNVFGIVNHPVSDSGLEQIHRSDAYLALLERFGMTVRDRSCCLALKAESVSLAERLLLTRGIEPDEPFCVLNTGGNWDLKQWPPGRFADLARRISRERGMKVVLTGAAGDVDRVTRIAALSGVGPIELAGVTDIEGTAAVFFMSKVVISADSGPLHLASALGVRTVAIFGPTAPLITGPRGRGISTVIMKDVGCNRSPCYYLECPDNRCMKAVEVADVIKVL